MVSKTELQFTLAAAAVVLLLAAGYALRLALKGRVHFDRVNQQGGSRLLGRGAMEMGYWSLEPVARLLVRLKIHPNQLTWLSLALGAVGAVYLARGHFGFGAIFATISALLDSLDGMVARLSGVASEAGEILDSAVDRYGEFFFVAGLLFYYRELPVVQGLALLVLLGSFMVSYSTAKAEALQLPPPSGSMRRPERAVYLILGAVLSALTVASFDKNAGSIVLNSWPMIAALAFVAVIANLSAVNRFYRLVQMVRQREENKLRRPPPIDLESKTAQAVRPPKVPLWVSLGRSQISSLIATAVDFTVLVLLVEVAHVWYVAATACGAFVGAVVNFILGRHWSFAANTEAVHGQVLRYTIISAASLALNSLGVYILTDFLSLHYTISKAITAVSVGLLFNFPLHRRFVFVRRSAAR